MTDSQHGALRFNPVTAIIWLIVASGIIFLLWQVIGRISTENIPVSTATPNLTQVYQTIAAILTEQQTVTPIGVISTVIPSPTVGITLSPTSPLKTASSPPDTAAILTPVGKCDQAAAGNPIDVTVPDDSLIPAGASFLKTWKLVNIGSCTWTSMYSASFFYGDRMGALESVPLPATVPPQQSVEISVEMVAPLSPGTYQGNWMLSNPAGELFGIGPNGDAPFWVRITVTETQNSTPTVEVTPTSAPTGMATSLPPLVGQASGEPSPVPGDTIDLDLVTVNNGDEDLDYQVDTNHELWLVPQPGTTIGDHGLQAPAKSDCVSAAMSPASIAVKSLTVGTCSCYPTNQGR